MVIIGGKQKLLCKDIEKIYENILVLASREGNEKIPYFILQPLLTNKKEYKVCILENPYTMEVREPFLCVNPRPASIATSFVSQYDYTPLYEFAKRAKAMYESSVSDLVYPVLRVDIMRMQNGRYVVNEFESLLGSIESAARGHEKKSAEDASTAQFLELFWVDELRCIINMILGIPKNRKRKHMM